MPGAADAPQVIRLAGLFPGGAAELCALPGQARLGPGLIEPIAALQEISLAGSPVQADGFVPWHGSAEAPGGGGAWHVRPSGRSAYVLGFHPIPVATSGRAFAVPFRMGSPASPPASLTLTLADGIRFDIELPSLWSRGDWRAAVLPASLVARHGGVAMVQVAAKGDGSLVVGTPLFVTLRPGWSKIF